MTSDLAGQIKANFEQVEAGEWSERERIWLTFYLSGPPVDLERLGRVLASNKWVNLGGWEGAFLYPKIEVKRARDAVIEAAIAAETLCAEHGVDLIAIDADTNPEVQSSHFTTLYRNLGEGV
ncbi:MAG: hypothetical protein ACAH11_08635 [Sphingomonas sp.]